MCAPPQLFPSFAFEVFPVCADVISKVVPDSQLKSFTKRAFRGARSIRSPLAPFQLSVGLLQILTFGSFGVRLSLQYLWPGK